MGSLDVGIESATGPMSLDLSGPVKSKSVFDTRALTAFLVENGAKPHHAENIQRHFIKAIVEGQVAPWAVDYTSVPSIPKRIPALLHDHFGLVTQVTSANRSAAGDTTKMLVRLPSGSLVETVVMHYDRSDKSASTPENGATHSATAVKPRTTVCISSQVGCKMACSFCATGTMGFTSHLTDAEIVEQLLHANRVQRINNVVFMGMGEPFDNYEALCRAIKQMTHTRLFGMGPRSLCVSTVGIVPKMRSFMVDCPGVKLALSLHAPTQEIRNEIVPTAKIYPLDTLMAAVDEYLTHSPRIMIEYILIRNVNCTLPVAHQLGDLLSSRRVILNLIPYNPTDTGKQYEAPTSEEVDEFERILRHEYGIRTTVRRTMGQDIDGACGQLVVKESMRNRKKTHKASCGGSGTANEGPRDLEDLVAHEVEAAAEQPAGARIPRITIRGVDPASATSYPNSEEDASIGATHPDKDHTLSTPNSSGDGDRRFKGSAANCPILPWSLAFLAGVLAARIAWKVYSRSQLS